ncbi:MAG: twin-arginine translocation signal domain-containing protein, partial [Armatimonadetes bacterium]|nr:twin-arginine translocation signal domain-containing protein [Anaerolineae bacterium]
MNISRRNFLKTGAAA